MTRPAARRQRDRSWGGTATGSRMKTCREDGPAFVMNLPLYSSAGLASSFSFSGALSLPSCDARTSFSACEVTFVLIHRGPYVGADKINARGYVRSSGRSWLVEEKAKKRVFGGAEDFCSSRSTRERGPLTDILLTHALRLLPARDLILSRLLFHSTTRHSYLQLSTMLSLANLKLMHQIPISPKYAYSS